jgi:hypothetical protein
MSCIQSQFANANWRSDVHCRLKLLQFIASGSDVLVPWHFFTPIRTAQIHHVIVKVSYMVRNTYHTVLSRDADAERTVHIYCLYLHHKKFHCIWWLFGQKTSTFRPRWHTRCHFTLCGSLYQLQQSGVVVCTTVGGSWKDAVTKMVSHDVTTFIKLIRPCPHAKNEVFKFWGCQADPNREQKIKTGSQIWI